MHLPPRRLHLWSTPPKIINKSKNRVEWAQCHHCRWIVHYYYYTTTTTTTHPYSFIRHSTPVGAEYRPKNKNKNKILFLLDFLMVICGIGAWHPGAR